MPSGNRAVTGPLDCIDAPVDQRWRPSRLPGLWIAREGRCDQWAVTEMLRYLDGGS